MYIIQILLTLIYLISSLYISSKIRRSIIFFFIICLSLQLIFAELNLYKIYAISVNTIIIFNLNIVFFLIGAVLYEYIYRNNKKSILGYTNFEDTLKTNSHYNVYNLIFIQCVFLYAAIHYLKKISYASLFFNQGESVRSYFFETGGLFSSYTEMFIYQYIIKNYIFVASFIFAYLLLIKKKLNILDVILIIISLIFIGIIAFTSQGRWDLMPPFLISIFLSLYIKNLNSKMYKRRVFPIISILSALLLIGIGVISMLRVNLDISSDNFFSSLNDVILEPFITYFSLPIAAFDYGLKYLFNDVSFFIGTATFAGFEELLFTPLIFLNHFFDYELANATLGSIMTPTFFFNGHFGWNALFTGVINYFLDFGYIGIVLYPLFIGFYFSKIIESFLRKNDIFYLLLMSVFFILLFNNMFSSSFQSFSNWILIISLIFYRKFFKLRFKII